MRLILRRADGIAGPRGEIVEIPTGGTSDEAMRLWTMMHMLVGAPGQIALMRRLGRLSVIDHNHDPETDEGARMLVYLKLVEYIFIPLLEPWVTAGIWHLEVERDAA